MPSTFLTRKCSSVETGRIVLRALPELQLGGLGASQQPVNHIKQAQNERAMRSLISPLLFAPT